MHDDTGFKILENVLFINSAIDIARKAYYFDVIFDILDEKTENIENNDNIKNENNNQNIEQNKKNKGKSKKCYVL